MFFGNLVSSEKEFIYLNIQVVLAQYEQDFRYKSFYYLEFWNLEFCWNWVYELLRVLAIADSWGPHRYFHLYDKLDPPIILIRLLGGLPVSGGFGSISWLLLTCNVPGLTVHLFGQQSLPASLLVL